MLDVDQALVVETDALVVVVVVVVSLAASFFVIASQSMVGLSCRRQWMGFSSRPRLVFLVEWHKAGLLVPD